MLLAIPTLKQDDSVRIAVRAAFCHIGCFNLPFRNEFAITSPFKNWGALPFNDSAF